MKVFVAGPDVYGEWIYGYEKCNSIAGADLLVLTGGADVNPKKYNQGVHSTVRFDDIRDAEDHKHLVDALVNNIPMIGICRGSQFLCTEAGGSLVQHCDNHGMAGVHKIITDSGDIFEITSTHHQMANPINLVSNGNAKILATAFPNRSTMKLEMVDGKAAEVENLQIEPEIVYYETLNAIGIQGHPESMNGQHSTVAYLNTLIQKLINEEEF